MPHLSTIAIVAGLAVTGLSAVYSSPVYAQDNPSEIEGSGDAAVATDSENSQETQDNSDELAKIRTEMAEMAEKLDHQSHEIETLKAQPAEHEEKDKTADPDFGDAEDALALASMGGEETFETERLISVFGFFDLTFFKGFLDENNLYALYIPASSTFVMTNANIYIKSEMTSHLSALLELKFSFLPHGKETSIELQTVMPDGTIIDTPSSYERVDTTLREPTTTLEFKQGGVTLERVHLTYSPFDWLNVIAGRYLTPFGIWNVDHGSPVVLPARIPMLQYREFVPLAQTGFQIYGRFFPGSKLMIDYAFTLSNGRGPMDAVYDLDENKGIGLRLKLTYTGRKVSFFAGAYGYTGESTDIKKQMVVYLNEDNTANLSGDNSTRLRIINTSALREYTMTYDTSVSFFGVTLQAEAAITRVLYSQNRSLGEIDSGFNGAGITEQWYMPSYTGYGAYVLAAYELPLPISWLRVTPYTVVERSVPMEVLKVQNLDSITVGLNLKPSPYVSIKGEYLRVHSDILGELNAMTFQLSVSF